MKKKIVKHKKGEMHWNYRVFRYKDGSFGVHEAYYDTLNGEPKGYTRDPIIVGDSVDELLDVLEVIAKDIRKDAPIIAYEYDEEKE